MRALHNFVVSLSVAAALTQPVLAEGIPPLQRGDVIFQNSLSAQSLAILLATDSPFTHVGIVDFDDAGNPVVLEAVRTTRATPLDDWITYGEGSDIAIYRLQDLTEDQALAVAASARTHFGKGYDPYFYKSEDTLYCSELVHIAFRDGMGIDLGRKETLADLNLDTDAARALIAERWQSHPSCSDGQASDAQSCLKLILDEPLVTPQAVAEDKRLELIYTNFGS